MAIPAAAYVPFVQTGNLVFLSGHIAKKIAATLASIGTVTGLLWLIAENKLPVW